MRSAFGNLDLIVDNPVYQPVLLIDSSRPEACIFEFQRVGFPNAFKWIARDVFKQFIDPFHFFYRSTDPAHPVQLNRRPDHGDFPMNRTLVVSVDEPGFPLPIPPKRNESVGMDFYRAGVL